MKTRKITAGKKMNKTSTISYDVSMGAIRMIDTSVVTKSSASVSPIKLSEAVRKNIKKPFFAKNV